MYVRKAGNWHSIENKIGEMYRDRAVHADKWFHEETQTAFETMLWEAVYPKNYQVMVNKLPCSYFAKLESINVKIMHLDELGRLISPANILNTRAFESFRRSRMAHESYGQHGQLEDRQLLYTSYRLDLLNTPYKHYNIPAILADRTNTSIGTFTPDYMKKIDWREELPPLVINDLTISKIATERYQRKTAVANEYTDFKAKVKTIFESVPSLNRFCKEWPPGRDLLPTDILAKIDEKRGKMQKRESDSNLLDELHTLYVKAKVAS